MLPAPSPPPSSGFPATLAFGWYVTRVAHYSLFYGSFGAGIATLVWLYITAFSVLIGAELNGALYRERQEHNSSPLQSGSDLLPSVIGLTGIASHAMHA